MRIEGYGGRPGFATNDLSVLNGLLFDGVSTVMEERRCANSKCGRYFKPRADGDDYCSEPCEFDSNPKFRPNRSSPNLSKAVLNYERQRKAHSD